MRVESEHTRRPLKIWASQLEDEALKQARNLANLPFLESHLALMADAHAGKGSTVGTVIATRGAIIPAAVGVDVGCGMSAARLPWSVDRFASKLPQLRNAIERAVPVGFSSNQHPCEAARDYFARTNPAWETGLVTKAMHQLGSLGGGNHFIELCFDETATAWVMLHSGSRNIGKTLAERHIHNAKGVMKRYFIDLPDPDLAYLAQGTAEFDAYISDLVWAQEYAAQNRAEMLRRVVAAVESAVGEPAVITLQVDCHHNYTALEHHFGKNVYVTRKGAVSAREGELGIIPGSMGTRSYIVCGKGNPHSFHSCSHGAGRRMSRAQARRQFTVQDLARQTDGVECRKDDSILDEIPGAYKDIEQVMADQTDLVDIVHTLKQVLCVKG